MDNYIEQWASKFKEIAHVPGASGRERRFYRIDGLFFSKGFFQNLTAAQSPSVAFVTRFDPTTTPDGKFWEYTHRIFILVKEDKAYDPIKQELATTVAKRKGIRIAEQLLAYMHRDREGRLPESNGVRNPLLQGLDQKATISHESVMYDGWWPIEIIIDQLIPRQQCVNPDDYAPIP